MSRLRLTLGLIAVALVASLLGLSTSRSAPKGGGSVPPGKIIYSYNGGVWQMNGDGSAKEAISGYAAGHPSRQSYGGHRWWIKTIDSELWATPDGVTFLQVTNAQSQDNGDGTITVVWLEDGWFRARPTWSNGGDTFMSVHGTQWTQFNSYPLGEGPMWDQIQGIYRIAVSADELELRYLLGQPGPALAQSQLELVVYNDGFNGGNLAIHHWSPDGTKLVYPFHQQDNSYPLQDIWVADVGPGAILPVNAATDGTMVFAWNHYTLSDLQWSPQADQNGQRICIKSGFVYTVRPDGGNLIQVSSLTLGTPRWSPDGQFLAYGHSAQRKIGTYVYDLYRIPASGGTSTQLTGDLNRYLDKRVLGWGD